jgi:hypothetical protein
MRRALFVLLLATLVPVGAALAREHSGDHAHLSVRHVDPPVDWGRRHDLARARFAILSEQRTAALVLTNDRVAIQLSDRALRELDREIARDKDDDDGFLAALIKSAVLGGVREMLDHSLECPIAQLRDVRYHDGRLVLVARNGKHVFEDLEIEDRDALESFSEHDAQAFVREFHRAKDQLR